MNQRHLHRFLAMGLVATFWVAGACSGSDSTGPPGGEEPDALLTNPADVSTAGDASDGGEALSTWVRFGNLVPDVGPFTVCIRGIGSSTATELFAGAGALDAGSDVDQESPDAPAEDASDDQSAGDAARRDARADAKPVDAGAPDTGQGPLAGGLAPYSVSAYERFDGAGTFKIALLLPGAGSCPTAVSEYTLTVTLDSDTYNTVVLAPPSSGEIGSLRSYLEAGDASPAPFDLLLFRDESGAPPDTVRTRFINAVKASPDTTQTDAGAPEAGEAGRDAAGSEAGVEAGTDAIVDVISLPPVPGLLSVAVQDPSTAALVDLALAVAPEHASEPSQAPPSIDTLGYHLGFNGYGDASGALEFRVSHVGQTTGSPWTSARADLDLDIGTVHTGFILSPKRGSVSQFQMLWCDDLVQKEGLTSCELIAQ